MAGSIYVQFHDLGLQTLITHYMHSALLAVAFPWLYVYILPAVFHCSVLECVEYMHVRVCVCVCISINFVPGGH